MSATTITGASDDLIEIDGQIVEEFPHAEETAALLAFSDGTLLQVEYDKDGIWRVKRLAAGECELTHSPGSVDLDTNDVAILTGDLRWCVYAVKGQYNPALARKP